MGKRVYLAGPYTGGDVAVNVRNIILAADALLSAGHVPFVPHLYHFWHLVRPRPYDDWLSLDLAWMPFCEVFVRLPGESPGAELEIEEARRLGLPVFYGVGEFLSGESNA